MAEKHQSAEIVTTNEHFGKLLRKTLLGFASSVRVTSHFGIGKTNLVRYFLSRLEDISATSSADVLPKGETRVVLFTRHLPAQAVPERLARLGLRSTKNCHLVTLKSEQDEDRLIVRLATSLIDDDSDSVLDAWWECDTLVVISPRFKRLHVPMASLPQLMKASEKERADFEIDQDGAFIYWPKLDLHFGWEQLLQTVDPKAYLRAKKEAAEFDIQYGSAIRQLREDSGLRQSDIPGLTPRQVGRIEHGESGTSYKALAKLANAHDLSLNDYFGKLAGLIPKSPAAQSETDVVAADDTKKVNRGSNMKEPGLDNRHADRAPKGGQIQQKRSDAINKNLPNRIAGFSPNATVGTMRKETRTLIGADQMSKNEIFIEKHDNGYAVLKPNAERASAVCPTQAQAIERAAEIAPTAEILVERVRRTDAGHPDKWRKP